MYSVFCFFFTLYTYLHSDEKMTTYQVDRWSPWRSIWIWLRHVPRPILWTRGAFIPQASRPWIRQIVVWLPFLLVNGRMTGVGIEFEYVYSACESSSASCVMWLMKSGCRRGWVPQWRNRTNSSLLLWCRCFTSFLEPVGARIHSFPSKITTKARSAWCGSEKPIAPWLTHVHTHAALCTTM